MSVKMKLDCFHMIYNEKKCRKQINLNRYSFNFQNTFTIALKKLKISPLRLNVKKSICVRKCTNSFKTKDLGHKETRHKKVITEG